MIISEPTKIKLEKERYVGRNSEVWSAIQRVEVDVKEFIKKLKSQASWNMSGIIGQSITAELHDIIDKLAGAGLL